MPQISRLIVVIAMGYSKTHLWRFLQQTGTFVPNLSFKQVLNAACEELRNSVKPVFEMLLMLVLIIYQISTVNLNTITTKHQVKMKTHNNKKTKKS